MKDYPLRAWVANGNGTEEYNLLPTKAHGDVRAVTINLQGENKVNLLFTVLSTDQRSKFFRGKKTGLFLGPETQHFASKVVLIRIKMLQFFLFNLILETTKAKSAASHSPRTDVSVSSSQ